MGLRELKKQRTRETILRVALDLFATQGFAATTRTDIAKAAEIAPSTLHAYFPSKDSIVFGDVQGERESVRKRIVDRPKGESTIDAIADWFTHAPGDPTVADPKTDRRRRRVIESDDSLRAQERLNRALFEDVLANAFAQELGEPPGSLRSRLMAAGASHALTSYESRPLDRDAAVRLIQAAMVSLETPPRPRADDAFAA